MKTRNVAISEDAWLRVVTWAASATMSSGRRVTVRKVVEDAVARQHAPPGAQVAGKKGPTRLPDDHVSPVRAGRAK
jgi:hypothetical protein